MIYTEEDEMLDSERETLAVRTANKSLTVLKSILGSEGGEPSVPMKVRHLPLEKLVWGG